MEPTVERSGVPWASEQDEETDPRPPADAGEPTGAPVDRAGERTDA